MKFQIKHRTITLKEWQGKRVYIEAKNTDNSKMVGRSGDWGFVSPDGSYTPGKGDKNQLVYGNTEAEATWKKILESAKEMLNPQPPKQNYVPYVDGRGQGW